MKQSQLNFKENTKNCVWCTFDDMFDFYWEARSGQILITPERHGKVYVSDNATASQVRKEITSWLKAYFNV
ncbi:hypothetical protein [Shewanella sp. YQ_9]|uniref:hypothetical protein n=1 Tax=Shewanella sp. YQ_9 TaxID=3367231 RepID=UPI00370BBF06